MTKKKKKKKKKNQKKKKTIARVRPLCANASANETQQEGELSFFALFFFDFIFEFLILKF